MSARKECKLTDGMEIMDITREEAENVLCGIMEEEYRMDPQSMASGLEEYLGKLHMALRPEAIPVDGEIYTS